MFADLIVIHVFHCTCISLIVKRLENFLICAIKDHIIIIISMIHTMKFAARGLKRRICILKMNPELHLFKSANNDLIHGSLHFDYEF